VFGFFLKRKQKSQPMTTGLRSVLSFRRGLAAYQSLSKKNRQWFWSALSLIFIGLAVSLIAFYFYQTKSVPTYGGKITEGVVGKPFAIHPFVPDGSTADSLLEQLVFSSLLKTDGQGNVIPDLAESYEILENGQTYVVSLRPNLKWHDNKVLDSQDVLFTVQLIKNPEANHPLYNLFRDIEVEVLTPRSIAFKLPKTFSFFPQYLTFKIIPKHIWGSIPIQNFAFSEYSLKPIGSGPYQFKKSISTKQGNPLQYVLAASPSYYLNGPYLQSFSLKFFSSGDEAMNALRKKEIDSLAEVNPKTFLDNEPDNFTRITPVIPQSFGLFFNLESNPLQDKAMRQAIQAALPVDSLFDQTAGLLNRATRIDSPVWFIEPPPYPYNPTTSETLLASLGWQDSDNDGLKDKKLQKRDKTPTTLELSLTILDSQDMQALGSFIQTELKKAGINLVLKPVDINEFHSRLRSRSFQMIIVGELPTSGYYPDLFPFFHSSQKPPQGMNFPGYTDKEIDQTLSFLREALELENKQEEYQKIAQAIKEDLPAIFLYRPSWTWLVSKTIKVPLTTFLNTPEEHLSLVNQWHLFTKRVWK
jgi:peptide/nickel transport system substrate-binding protein